VRPFDIGAEKDEETEQRNGTQAAQIARLVRDDRDLRGRVTVHMRTTGSHAKLILLDTADDGWITGVGSCNWLSSPFQTVELTVLLRDQRAVAEVAVALQNIVGRRGLADTPRRWRSRRATYADPPHPEAVRRSR
jgi:cardiolipin synthase A/B